MQAKPGPVIIRPLRKRRWASHLATLPALARDATWRHRLWPLAIAGVLALARWWATTASPLTVTGAALLTTGIVTVYLRARGVTHPADWWYAATCLTALTTGLTVTSLAGTPHWANVTAVTLWFVLSLQWWGHTTRPPPAPPEPVQETGVVADWNTYVRDRSGPTAGATLTHVGPFEHGDEYRIRVVPGNQHLGTFEGDIKNISTALDAPLHTLLIEQDPDVKSPRILRLRHVTTSPIEKPVFFTGPKTEDGRIVLGPYADGMGFASWRIFTENSMCGGFVLGDMGSGKALDVDTPIPIPTGWTTMGALQAGDEVFDETGAVRRVVRAFNVQYNRPCYEVTFSDGNYIVADEDHLWWTEDIASRLSESRQRRNSPTAKRKPRLSPEQCAALRLLGIEHQSITIKQVSLATGLCCASSFLRDAAATVGATGRSRDYGLYHQNGLVIYQPMPWALTYPSRELINGLISDCDRIINDQRHKRMLGGVRTTREIANTLLSNDWGISNHSIPVAKPLSLPHADLPIPPYVLGCWLGDGDNRDGTLTTADPEIIDLIRDCGYSVRAVRHHVEGTTLRGSIYGLRHQLRLLGLLHNKHIPAEYLRASGEQRRQLLAGLLDTDGTVAPQGTVHFDSTNQHLALGVLELAITLGYRATVTEKDAKLYGRVISRAWRVAFTTADKVFRLNRKNKTLSDRTVKHNPSKTGHRYIVDVRPVASRPVRCIEVDSPSHLFLAGRNMVATHNSRLLELIGLGARSMGVFIVYIDGQNGASSPILWEYADWHGGPEDANTILAALIRGKNKRQVYNKHHRLPGFTPGEGLTAILSIVDECHVPFEKPGDAKQWSNLVREQRKIGGATVAASQFSGIETFGNQEPLRQNLIAGNGVALRTSSKLAPQLVPGLDIDPALFPPDLPGYGYYIDASKRRRTAPFRSEWLPDAKDKLKDPSIPVLTVEEWYQRLPCAVLDEMTAGAFGPDYLNRHEIAAAQDAKDRAWLESSDMEPPSRDATRPGTEGADGNPTRTGTRERAGSGTGGGWFS